MEANTFPLLDDMVKALQTHNVPYYFLSFFELYFDPEEENIPIYNTDRHVESDTLRKTLYGNSVLYVDAWDEEAVERLKKSGIHSMPGSEYGNNSDFGANPNLRKEKRSGHHVLYFILAVID